MPDKFAHFLLFLVLAVGVLISGPSQAQPAEPTPDQVRALAELLRDPAVAAWLQDQAGNPPATASGVVSGAGEGPGEGIEGRESDGAAQRAVSGWLDSIEAFLEKLSAGVPLLPADLGRAWSVLAGELQRHGPGALALLLAAFAAFGFGVEWLFRRATARFRRRIMSAWPDTARERLRVIGLRSVLGFGVLAAFSLGSVGAFLLFDWPPLPRQVVLTYLLAFLIVRLTLVLGRLILAPGAERFRVLPMATKAARFWLVWAAVLVGWFCLVKFTLDLLALLGTGRATSFLVGLAGGAVLLALAIYVIWRRPDRETGGRLGRRGAVGRTLLSLYLAVLWLLVLSGSAAPLHVGIVLLLLPIALRCVGLAVNHVLRPADSETADETVPTLAAVGLERGLRAALLVCGGLLIASLAGVDFGALTARDTLVTRLFRGAISAVIILLVADLAWQLARAWIDRKLVEASGAGPTEGDEGRRQGRLRTLLPIFRSVLSIALIVIAGLTALSSLGIEIGPLIAGAGVVGLAIGFGAQTLVKDVISGMFFLLDDAFRVGEYIESGSIRGTVEAFSLRSMKLRHHRGALHTIPFGSLDKITNYSRDWVIDKMTINLAYDTDLDQVKKIIKQIGRELQEIPEFQPHILDTLKMQGVEQFGDFAIQVRLKVMTKPGEQFLIRRRAYALIKTAFKENGIVIASPTVKVAGGRDDAAAAAAHTALTLAQNPKPAS